MSRPTSDAQYVDYDDFIRHHLERARAGIRWADILTAAVGLAVFLTGYLLVFAVFDHWIVAGGFGPTARAVMLAAVVAGAVAWVATKVVRPVVRRVNPLYAASEIERAHPEFGGTLFGLVDAERDDDGRGVRPLIAAALRKRAARGLSSVDPDETVDRRMLMRLSLVLLAMAVLGCAYAVFSPKSLGNAINRAFLPSSETAVATRTRIIDVVPGDATLAAGEVLDIAVEYADADPERPVVLFTTDDRRAVDAEVELLPVPDRVKRLGATWAGVAGSGVVGSAEYTVRVGDATAGPFRLKVLTPPTPEIESISLTPPAYTGLPATDSSGPAVDGVEGTEAVWRVTSDRPLRTAKVVFADEEAFVAPAEELTLSAIESDSEGAFRYEASWDLTLRPDGTSPAFYRIEAVDEDGIATVRPPVYPVSIRPDEPPVVEIRRPKGPVTRKPGVPVDIDWAAGDPDFALRDVILRTEKNGASVPQVIALYEGSDKSASGRHRFDLKPLRAKEGDVVTVWLQARDNREPDANRQISDRLEIRISNEKPEPPPKKDDDRREQDAGGEDATDGAGAGDGQPAGEGAAGEGGEPGEGDGQGEPGEGVEQAGGEPGDEGQADPAAGDGESGEPGGEGRRRDGRGGELGTPEDGASEASADGPSDKTGPGDSPDPVKRDGTEDDRALRELLDQYDKQQEPPQDGGGGQDGGSEQASDPGGSSGEAPESPAGEDGTDGDAGATPGAGDTQGEDSSEGGSNGASSDSDGGASTPGETDRPAGSDTGERPEGGRTDGGPESPGDPDKGGRDGGPSDGTESGPARGDKAGDDLPNRTEGDVDREGPEGEKIRREAENKSGEDERQADAGDSQRQPGTDGDSGGGQAGDDPDGSEGASGERPGDGSQPAGPSDDKGGKGRTPEGGQEAGGRPEDTSDAERPDRAAPDGGPSPGQSKTGEPGPADENGDAASGDGESRPGEAGKPWSEGSESGGSKSASEGSDGQGQSAEGGGQPGEGESGEGEAASDGAEGSSGGKPNGSGGSGEGGESADGESSGGSQPAQGGSPGQSGGEASSGDGGGVGSDEAGGGAGRPGDGTADGPNFGDGEAGGDDRPLDTSDPDDLRKATDLVLDRLEDDLRRGEVDRELLDRLNWTEDDLKKFAERMRNRRERPAPAEGRANAFDQLLESVRRGDAVSGRRGTTRTAPEAGGTSGRQPPPPADLADRFEAFTRRVAGERDAE